MRALQHAQTCLLYILAHRLDSPAQQQLSTFGTLMQQHRSGILGEWLQKWLLELTPQLSEAQTTGQDRKVLHRLAIAGRMLPQAGARLADASTRALTALSSSQGASDLESKQQDGAILTDESCAACETQLTISWDHEQQDFGWAKCQSGHVWRKYTHLPCFTPSLPCSLF